MFKRITALAALFLIAGVSTAADVPPAPREKPLVQIALLLDTSSSMNGLIDQAKTHLWKVVNEFARASRDGVRPEIEVALYHYGTPSLGAEGGYIKQLVPMSTDLDKVSDELFKLKTAGGSEYCGWVIKRATEELTWSADKRAYKAIFIAGNEPFTQGAVKYDEAVKAAISRGIIVNTIFCGPEHTGAQTGWKDGATLGDGSYVSINMNRKAVAIAAPQDKEIAELSAKLNSTYVGYGAQGKARAELQKVQDANAAAAAPSASVERAVAKAGEAYKNSAWDVVDAVKEGKLKLADARKDELPEEMRELDAKQREEFVARKAAEREALQKKVQELSDQRAKYLAEECKKQSETTGEKTLDAALIETVRSQARRVDLTFEEKK